METPANCVSERLPWQWQWQWQWWWRWQRQWRSPSSVELLAGFHTSLCNLGEEVRSSSSMLYPKGRLEQQKKICVLTIVNHIVLCIYRRSMWIGKVEKKKGGVTYKVLWHVEGIRYRRVPQCSTSIKLSNLNFESFLFLFLLGCPTNIKRTVYFDK